MRDPADRRVAARTGRSGDDRTAWRRLAAPAGPAAPTAPHARRKRPFDIDEVMAGVRDAVADKPKAVLFELAERGYVSPFEILVACIITIRTLEEVSLPTSLRLLEVARTPEQSRSSRRSGSTN